MSNRDPEEVNKVPWKLHSVCYCQVWPRLLLLSSHLCAVGESQILENAKYKKERFCFSTDPLLSDPNQQHHLETHLDLERSNGASKRHDLINAFVALLTTKCRKITQCLSA